MTYTIDKAHADGRHASPHPEDRLAWMAAGCTDCALLYDEHGLPLACLDAHVITECHGPVEYRAPLSGTGRSFPRCEAHWSARLDRQAEINARYAPNSDVPPADFDPTYAGETW